MNQRDEMRCGNESLWQLRIAALEAAANAIVIADRRGTIVWVNPAFCDLTGYTFSEVIGQNPRILKSGKHDETFYRSLWRTIVSGETWRGEFINRRKDGSLFHDDHTITPVRSEGGEITHFIGVMHDITARKHLEERLREARKMESVGRLAGGVAHDFNNILAVIQGHASVLFESLDLTTMDRHSVEAILTASERAATLIRQMLAFSEKQMLRCRELDLNKLIGECMGRLRQILGEEIALQVDTADVPRIHADPAMLQQVLANLALNAREAMPAGGKFTISTGTEMVDSCATQQNPEARHGMASYLRVTDTGCGIAPEHLPNVFEPFFTTKDVGKGPGMGLSTVHGIVRQHRGWITVDSAVNQGTTFKIYLPIGVRP